MQKLETRNDLVRSANQAVAVPAAEVDDAAAVAGPAARVRAARARRRGKLPPGSGATRSLVSQRLGGGIVGGGFTGLRAFGDP